MYIVNNNLFPKAINKVYEKYDNIITKIIFFSAADVGFTILEYWFSDETSLDHYEIQQIFFKLKDGSYNLPNRT